MWKLPLLIPRPPLPGESFLEVEGEEEATDPDSEFRSKLRSEGYDKELVEMGLKVMKNHMRPKEEAFEIGRNYIKEMAK